MEIDSILTYEISASNSILTIVHELGKTKTFGMKTAVYVEWISYQCSAAKRHYIHTFLQL